MPSGGSGAPRTGVSLPSQVLSCGLSARLGSARPGREGPARLNSHTAPIRSAGLDSARCLSRSRRSRTDSHSLAPSALSKVTESVSLRRTASHCGAYSPSSNTCPGCWVAGLDWGAGRAGAAGLGLGAALGAACWDWLGAALARLWPAPCRPCSSSLLRIVFRSRSP